MAAISKGQPTNKGLIGYWPLGNLGTIKGTVAVDLSGRQNTGGLVASPPLTMGNGGAALSLNGSSQYVSVPSSISFDAIPGTWAAWIRTSTVNGGYPVILCREDVAGSNGIDLFLDTTTAQLSVQIHGSSGAAVLNLDPGGGPALTDGKTHHIALVFTQNTGTSYLYVDGSQVASGTPSASWNFNSQAFLIGKAANGFWKLFLGAIWGVRFYQGALPASAIRQLYINGRNSNFGLIVSQARRAAALSNARGLFLPSSINGLGSGGAFFHDRLAS